MSRAPSWISQGPSLVHANAKRGINYLSGSEIQLVMSDVFPRFEYVDDTYTSMTSGRSRHLAATIRRPLVLALFRLMHARVIPGWQIGAEAPRGGGITTGAGQPQLSNA
jgi:hypothetical protein